MNDNGQAEMDVTGDVPIVLTKAIIFHMIGYYMKSASRSRELDNAGKLDYVRYSLSRLPVDEDDREFINYIISSPMLQHVVDIILESAKGRLDIRLPKKGWCC